MSQLSFGRNDMRDDIKINEIIDDRYKVLECLGEGGMAIVYKAHDLINDRDIALKMMKKETAANKVNLNRFEREARAAAPMVTRKKTPAPSTLSKLSMSEPIIICPIWSTNLSMVKI